jgi:Ca2+-binding RTX toxin-like protein
VTEAAGAGFDTVAAAVDYTLPSGNNVEVLNMIGAGLTGTGSNGAETLISSSGPNTLIGLGGNDVYYVNDSADLVVEAASGGMDTVEATVDYTLPASNTVEGLYMLGSGLTGTGSNGAETLYSSGGPNTLVGLGSDDLYYVNNTADAVTETAGGGFDSVMATVSYTLPADVEVLYLNGAGLTGTGSGGNDTLVTLGANTLVGAGGDDAFVFISGQANGAAVADFDGQGAGQGDYLIFSGFGTSAQGATFNALGGNSWQIHSGLDAHNEIVTFSNGASIETSDFVFV